MYTNQELYIYKDYLVLLLLLLFLEITKPKQVTFPENSSHLTINDQSIHLSIIYTMDLAN